MKIFFLILCFINFNYCELSFQNSGQMLNFVKEIIPKNPVILEAGGHYGEDTIVMKSIWPEAIMHVFEPLNSSFKKLLENTKNLTNVFLYESALNNYSGFAKFYIDIPNNAASSLGYPVEWNEHEFDKNPLIVPCITINDWSKKYNIKNIDFMWLDIEGHELYVLQNATDILKTVKAIYTEISFVHIRENSGLYIDLKKFLLSQNFKEVWKENDSGRFSNALYIK